MPSPVTLSALLLAVLFVVALSLALKGGGGRPPSRPGGAGAGGPGLHSRVALFQIAVLLAAVCLAAIPPYRVALSALSGAAAGACCAAEAEAAARLAAARGGLSRAALLHASAAFALGALAMLANSALLVARARRLLDRASLVLGAADARGVEAAEAGARMRGSDEIAALSSALGGIAGRLAGALEAGSSLGEGKRLQRRLLPLGEDENGESLDFGWRDAEGASFFAYYEESAEISGDYFDYRSLDGRHYAIIKCDVAGSGAPAALVTMQVSTMFLSYFRSWEPGRLMHIGELVYMINDFIERMGASGCFAALALCVFDTKTGDLHFCNAGDSVVRIYDSLAGRVRAFALPETPAAGILPYGMVAARGGYRVRTLSLAPGDVLLLHTDGLEESRRRYRGPVFDGKPACAGTNRMPHGNFVAGHWGEEFGERRVREVVDAVMGRRPYRMRKWHAPDGREEFLNFDFSACAGGAEDAVLALVAAEKMFRCYRAPGLSAGDQVPVSRKVDAFLRAHFAEYGAYCSSVCERPGDGSRVRYAYLKEERRHDDMAILGIERKRRQGEKL